ncbi:MAG TPA: energy transducer TonB [Terriglobales bacterium]|nr:energy transducer TonB [Terriglobales bacterium]
MSFQVMRRWLAVGLVVLAFGVVVVRPSRAFSEDQEISRKVKSKVAPVYPDIARRMSISGTVKLVVVVSPNGAVKSTKVLGGHPLLVTAAEEAVKKWKFETASEESSGVVEFTFRPEN